MFWIFWILVVKITFKTNKSGKTPETVQKIMRKQFSPVLVLNPEVHDDTEEDVVRGFNLPGYQILLLRKSQI